MTKIFILILNYRRHQDTATCVNYLERSDMPRNSQIIILDNTEDNSSKEYLSKKFARLTLIKNEKNLGFAKANNRGIRLALKNKATHILIINPDVEVPSKFFSPLLKHFKNKKTGLVAPALKHKVKNKVYYGLEGHLDWQLMKPRHSSALKLSSAKPIKAEFLTFACVLIKSEVFKKTGLLDERYFMYLEDVDFCLSAGKKGYELYLDPKVVARHETSASFAHPRHKLKISFISHLKFITKWLPFPNNIRPLGYQFILYPYLYVLWSYHHWKYTHKLTS